MPDARRADTARAALPRAPEFDATLALLREGAGYISARADRLGTDVFRTRLALRPVICMRGAEAAEIFYGGDRFTRRGAMPASIRHLLQDDGSVQGLDGAAHRHRKAMFTGLMLDDSIRRLAGHFAAEWRSAVPGWQAAGQVVLARALPQLLFRAAAIWAGVPVADAEATRRADEMEAMIVNAGRLGPSNWWARLRRHRTEAWARRVIGDLRAGAAGERSPALPAAAIAAHRDEAGQLLPEAVAAVELINLLRPVVAVGHFILFAALALHHHPEWRARFATGADEDLEPFAQEIRRTTPFFPAVAGRVLTPFTWRGIDFAADAWVLFDIHGTDTHPALWADPAAFRPERFRGWGGDPWRLVPQGAGLVGATHRCPGERITLELIKEAVRLLCRDLDWRLPPQDLTVDPARLPACPADGLVLADLRPCR
ncbi:cytochrome P450 [Tistrella mobilis]